MVRTQVQLTKSQMKALREAAVASGKSVAELIRRGVDRYLARRSEPTRHEGVERAILVAGRFRGGRADVSAKHDKYLAEAFKE